jgi:signal transduction histidine kinase/AraC-like DNA-binding protein/ABC-type sugar transport system substrate-binding protein
MSQALRVGLHITPDDPYWVLVREAIYQRAEQCAIQLISVDIPDPRGLAEQAQVSWVEELLAQGLDALISKDLHLKLCLQIMESGLPIIYATEVDLSHPLFASPFTLYSAAQMIGRYLVERLSGQGSVLVVGGPTHPEEVGPEDNYKSRVDGIYDVLREFPLIRQHYLPGPWFYDQAFTDFQVSMRQLAEPVDAVFGLSDSLALAGRDAGRVVGIVNQHTLITGVNGDLLALAAIADGSMAATVETSATNFGSQLIDLACQAAQGQALPAHFNYELTLVTSDNVAEIMKQKLVAIANLPTRLIGVNRQEEQKRLAQLETSLEIHRRIGSTLDRQQLLNEIADLIRVHYGYDQVYLFKWSETEQTLNLDQPDKTLVVRRSIPLVRSGLLGQALSGNELIFIPDALRSRRYPPDPNHPTTRSRVVLPIRLGNITLGLLDLHSNRPTQHTRQGLVGLQLLADQLGIAIRNAELYEEAVQARAIAEKADQLKTRLLANVSHELRTPLNIILGYSQSALASPNPYDIELPSMLQRDLSQIYNGGEHLLRLINDLLDLSRAEIDELSLVPETVAPRAFLEEVFHGFAGSAATEQLTWLLHLPERLPLIQADPVRLRQILLNLLANARKFTNKGHILLGAEVEPPHLHIWVEDTGIGIPVDQQERIFEPFVTVERLGRRSEGVGLGLAVTRRLVALHRGSMTLESQAGRGSTFHVYLPLPSLSGQPVMTPATAQPVLLLISTQACPAPSIDDVRLHRGWTTRHLRPADNLDQVLAEVQPMALAWDLAHASPGDWMMVQQIRNHPQLCQLPFILFGQEQDDKCASVVTGVVTKPLGGQTLVDMIEALHPPAVSGPILIVDDDPQALALYQSIVANALPGYPIRVADNGPAALVALGQEIPALIILDLIMPEVDGFTILAQVRADRRTCHVPVLVISGYILSTEDIKRLDHAQVVFQIKDILSENETAIGMRRVLLGEDILPQSTSILVKQTIACIQQNYAQRLSRQQIAKAVGVSEDYLGRIFQQELGISPMEYLNRYRIKEAKALLNHTCASITDIAAQVGFDDPAYFSRAFRKLVNFSPRAYRKQTAKP